MGNLLTSRGTTKQNETNFKNKLTPKIIFMKTKVAFFGKETRSSFLSFENSALTTQELNSVRGGTDPLVPSGLMKMMERKMTNHLILDQNV